MDEESDMLNRSVLLIFIGGLMVVCLAPFDGKGFGMSPISLGWAAPTCDSDNDGHDKNSGKWCTGDDLDDSDPCIPDKFAPACSGSGGGGNDCNLQFDATFYPQPSTDGLRSDTGYEYHAEGGVGFRLYTTGGADSSRQVLIDFAANNQFCDEKAQDPLNPGEAAGFCMAVKDVDMRIERQVQQIDLDLCSLDPVPDPSTGDPDSFRRTIVVNFESGPVDQYSLVDPDRRGNPKKPQALKLSYGCEAQFVPSNYLDSSARALVSRVGDTWTIVGERACLMTQTGEVLLSGDEPIWFNMPFGLNMVKTN